MGKKELIGPDGNLHLYPRYWMFPGGAVHLKCEAPGENCKVNWNSKLKPGEPVTWEPVSFGESRCTHVQEDPDYEEPDCFVEPAEEPAKVRRFRAGCGLWDLHGDFYELAPDGCWYLNSGVWQEDDNDLDGLIETREEILPRTPEWAKCEHAPNRGSACAPPPPRPVLVYGLYDGLGELVSVHLNKAEALALCDDEEISMELRVLEIREAAS